MSVFVAIFMQQRLPSTQLAWKNKYHSLADLY